MLIGITGSGSSGKSSFIKQFLKKYPKYTTPEETYRDIPNLDLYDNGTEESQRLIRDFMFKQAKEAWSKRDTKRHVFHDRTLLDNLACTQYLYTKGKILGEEIISDEFLVESINMTRESMGFYHIIYFTPISDSSPIPVRDDVDVEYRNSIDTILKSYYYAYKHDDRELQLFPEKNCASLQELIGDTQMRLEYAGMILDEDGVVIGGTNSIGMTPVDPLLYDAEGNESNLNALQAPFEISSEGDLFDIGLDKLITTDTNW